MSEIAAWPHQEQAVRACAERPASMLHMGMGTGKTRVALDLLRAWGAENTLVLAPLSVLSVWPSQAELHAPGVFRVICLEARSTQRRASELRRFILGSAPPRLLVVNYDACWRGRLGEALLGLGVHALVADESHRLKAPWGKASKFVAALARSTRRRLALTGTPMPHDPLDLWAQFRILDPALLGHSFVQFRSTYANLKMMPIRCRACTGVGHVNGLQCQRCRGLGRAGEAPILIGWKNQERLAQLVGSITHRCDRNVLSLPPWTDNERACPLGARAAAMYRGLESDVRADAREGSITAVNALTRLLRLQQITGGWATLDPEAEDVRQVVRIDSAKEDALTELLLGADPGDSFVVFCRFRPDLTAVHLAARAASRGSAEISGARKELPEWRAMRGGVLAAQIQAGGLGLDLTRARYCVFYSLGYSLGEYEQARARISRPGQDRPVTYYHLVSPGTVDRAVYRALRHKRDVIEHVLAYLSEEKNGREEEAVAADQR